MSPAPAPRGALVVPGNRAARDRADPAASRFAALFDALTAAGVAAEPAIWHEDFEGEVRAQLPGVQAVLAWCDPIEDGRRRDRLDAVRRLASKDVPWKTRDLPAPLVDAVRRRLGLAGC